jgi:hypothetical protein
VTAVSSFFGASWAPDSRHVYFSRHQTCSEDILRIDGITPGVTDTIFNQSRIATDATTNPTDENDILFYDQSCGSQGQLMRLDAGTGQKTSIPGVLQGLPRRHQWAPDGSMFAYSSPPGYVYTHDFTSPSAVLSKPPGVTLSATPCFGNDNERLYVKLCFDNGDCDIVSIDRATGNIAPIGLDIGGPTDGYGNTVSWVELDIDIDRDGDGLANGIDPTPDGN